MLKDWQGTVSQSLLKTLFENQVTSIAVYIYSYQCTTGSVLESKRPVIKGTSAELELSVQFKGTRSHFPNLKAKDCNWPINDMQADVKIPDMR